jgi:hypothetical protein
VTVDLRQVSVKRQAEKLVNQLLILWGAVNRHFPFSEDVFVRSCIDLLHLFRELPKQQLVLPPLKVDKLSVHALSPVRTRPFIGTLSGESVIRRDLLV